MDPIDAFEWLLREFRRYTRGETIWLDVREVLAEAENLMRQYRPSAAVREPDTEPLCSLYQSSLD